MKQALSLIALAVVACAGLRADFSYEQTTQVTGGMMKSLSFMSQQMREPIRGSALFKGDRMAHIGPTSASIVDLRAETITDINFQKKTYSVMTFAQMAEMLKSLDAKMKSKDENVPEWSVKASVKETGQTQSINGMTARQVILTLEFEGTDPKTNQKATMMTMTSDMWLAPEPAGYGEVKRFQARMAQKLAFTPGVSPMMSGGAQGRQGMAALRQEAAKLQGVVVRQVTKMSFAGSGAQGGEGGAEGQAEPQPQTQPQPQPQVEPEKPSIGGALGRLGGRFGGLGGLGRKKQQPQEQPKPETQQAPAQSAPAESQPQTQRGPGGSLAMTEMTTDMSGFSSAPVDGSKFEIPAGFKQVESQSLRGR